uniref:Putative secreted protein n=1 Tax=Psorophora albipes TaxID=869069 RepID=T1DFU9_9DIPT
MDWNWFSVARIRSTLATMFPLVSRLPVDTPLMVEGIVKSGLGSDRIGATKRAKIGSSLNIFVRLTAVIVRETWNARSTELKRISSTPST